MSMMNANAAATTAMTTNEPLDFVLPEMGDADFSSEELAEDTDGLTNVLSPHQDSRRRCVAVRDSQR